MTRRRPAPWCSRSHGPFVGGDRGCRTVADFGAQTTGRRGAAAWFRADVTRSPPSIRPSPHRSATMRSPQAQRRPGRKERHAAGQYRRPVDVSRLPQDQDHHRRRPRRPHVRHPEHRRPDPRRRRERLHPDVAVGTHGPPRHRRQVAGPPLRRQLEPRLAEPLRPELQAPPAHARGRPRLCPDGQRRLRHEGPQRRDGRDPHPARRLQQRGPRPRPAADGDTSSPPTSRTSAAATIPRSGRGSGPSDGRSSVGTASGTHCSGRITSRRPTGAPMPERRGSQRACTSATARTSSRPRGSLAGSWAIGRHTRSPTTCPRQPCRGRVRRRGTSR